MARSFLVPINLNSLELQNFIVHNLTGDPGNVAGRMYYNSSDNTLKFYKAGSGAGWQTVATGGSAITIGTTAINIGSSATTVEGLTLSTSSVWNGNTIGVAYGGTGTTTGSITGTGLLTFTAGAGNNSINLRPTGTGSVDLGSTNGTDGFRLTGLKDPSSDYDAANKKYVDGVAAGLNAHPAVNYATTGALGTTGNLVGGTITTTYSNGTNGNGATITVATSSNWTEIKVDGQTVTAGDRILIKNQGGTSSSLQNGLYTVTSVGAVGNTTSFVFTRAADSNSTPEVGPGDLAYVLAGTNNGGNGFVQTATIVAIGTTPIAWSQFSGSSATVAGLGLAPNGTNPNEIDVQVGTGIFINGSNQVALANTAVTANSYGSATAVGTFTVDAQGRLTAAATTSIAGLNASVITAGTLTVGVGGTGAGSFTSGGILRGNGTSALSVASAADIVAAIGSTAVANATSATSAGTATVSNTAAFTDDTASTATTFYPTFVSGTTSPAALKVSSTKLSYQPSTGTLTSTVFSGSGASLTSLNASNLGSGTVPGDRGVSAGSTSSSFVEYNGTTAASGQFDGGTAFPTGTTRLNYSGTFVAKQLVASTITSWVGNSGSSLTISTPGGGFAPSEILITTGGSSSTGGSIAPGNIRLVGGNLTGANTLGSTAPGTFIVGGDATNGYGGGLTVITGSGSNGRGTVNINADGNWGTVTPGGVGIASASTVITGGKTTLAVHTTGYASLNIPSASATLGTVASGDLWNLSGVLQFNNGTATKQIAYLDSNITGSAASAGSVTNSLVIKADSGTTEGTDLYTFNGSAAKTLNLVSGTGITLAETTGTITFNNSGVTSVNGSSGAIGATANSNGAITRYYRATCAAATTTAINHGLGQWVLVQVYKTSDGTIADVDVTNTSTSGGTTTVGFTTAPGAGDYTIVIIG